MLPDQLKAIILRAQDINELSWVVDKTNSDGECVEGHYSLSHRQAAEKAMKETVEDLRWIEVIYLLNYYAWNDVQDWSV